MVWLLAYLPLRFTQEHAMSNEALPTTTEAAQAQAIAALPQALAVMRMENENIQA